MSIYLPSLLDKFKDFVNGLKANWEDYIDHKDNTTDAHGIDVIAEDLADHAAETAEDDVHGLAGKIIEDFGSNDDGSWVRWSNGLQVCWHTVFYPHTDLTAGTHTKTWTLPVSFTDGYYAFLVHLNTVSSDAGRGTVKGQRATFRSSSSAEYYFSISNNFAAAASVELFAVGWWK